MDNTPDPFVAWLKSLPGYSEGTGETRILAAIDGEAQWVPTAKCNADDDSMGRGL